MKLRAIAGLALGLTVAACGQTPQEFRPLPTAVGDLRGVAMGFERLRPLGEGEGLYGAWINLENNDVGFLGLFNVNADGRPVDRSGDVIDRFPAGANLFNSVSIVVAIEPTGSSDQMPSQGIVLQGPFFDGVANLSVPAPLLLDQATGSYRVFSPTDGPDTNESAGVWAVSETGEALLELPPLNSVYIYEHFAVIDGKPVTMARFTSANEPDFFNPFSGDLEAPVFPGEDFLRNAPSGLDFPADLSGAQLLVTLESVLDDSIQPGQLVILEGTLPGGLQGGEIVELTNRVSDFPTGVAAIF